MIENSEFIIGKHYFVTLFDQDGYRIEEAIFTGVKTRLSGFELAEGGRLLFLWSNGDIFNSKEEAEKTLSDNMQ